MHLLAALNIILPIQKKQNDDKKESELPELNQRPLDLQSNALPTELSSVILRFLTCSHDTPSYLLSCTQAIHVHSDV